MPSAASSRCSQPLDQSEIVHVSVLWRACDGLYVAPQGRLRLAYIDYEAPDFVRRVRSAMHGKLRAQNEDAQ
eukprot:COSAG02_NODE_15559_length_1160_cov_1.256362_1_plen_71_part_10